MPVSPNDSRRTSGLSRRSMLEAGAIGLLGLTQGQLLAACGLAAGPSQKRKSVIFLFLTGGLSHQDSFDLKPDAPDTVRGEFKPIATRTPGVQICEHLPLLAARSEHYALVRSIATNSSGHGEACHMLLTGRLDFPSGFIAGNAPSPNEWPSIAAQATYALTGKSASRSLPPAAVLPEPSVNEAGEVRPGQYAGRLGPNHEAWHLHLASACPLGNGACPHCFRFDKEGYQHGSPTIFNTPQLKLPEGGPPRLRDRVQLLSYIEEQQRHIEQTAGSERQQTFRDQAVAVLADPNVQGAFDVEQADAGTLDRYGKNKFGLSMLMAFRLVTAGVSLVQVNVGKNSSWDTHRRNFLNLRENLLPYLDRAVSALLDDLSSSGLLEDTLVVLTGEFGRTPKINPDAGRDHWGPVMTSLFAGGGVRGGSVIGATDNIAAQPISDRQTTENLAATVYQALGIPRESTWTDIDGRPHELYRAGPIRGLIG